MGARSNLSPEKRAQIVALSEAGFYKRRIAADLQYNQASVGIRNQESFIRGNLQYMQFTKGYIQYRVI